MGIGAPSFVCWWLVVLYDAVDQTVGDGLIGLEEPVALHVLVHLVE
jgi:hypothetical protein